VGERSIVPKIRYYLLRDENLLEKILIVKGLIAQSPGSGGRICFSVTEKCLQHFKAESILDLRAKIFPAGEGLKKKPRSKLGASTGFERSNPLLFYLRK